METIGVVLVGVVVVVLGFVVVSYNALVRLRNKAEEAWSGIDVELQRRNDLVPNLVEVVRSYAGHERETFERVTAARDNAVGATGVIEAEVATLALVGALQHMFGLVEDYPELQASNAFLELQRQLAIIEEDISFARRYHNAVVEDLNTRIQTFPTVLVAAPLGFRARPFFQARGEVRAVPKVDFSEQGSDASPAPPAFPTRPGTPADDTGPRDA